MFKRIITAGILIPILIFAILTLPPLAFNIFALAIVVLAAWEFSRLASITYLYFRLAYLLVISLIIIAMQYSFILPILLLNIIVLVWFGIALWCYEKRNTTAGLEISWLRALLGIILLVGFWVGFVFVKDYTILRSGGLLYVLAIICGTDTGAYFAGRLFGKKLFAPKISPKKTWVGFWGGMLTATVIAVLVIPWLSLSLNQKINLFVLSIVTALISVIGDLAISLLKRIAGVKDSGNILPGHGGVLDRIDSIIAGIIVFALGALILGL